MSQSLKPASIRHLQHLDRTATRQFLIPALLLMENAGIACEQEIEKRYARAQRFLIVCGHGNNGGDGFVLARRLWSRGKNVTVFHFGAPPRMLWDASLNFKILQKLHVPCLNLLKERAMIKFTNALKKTDVVVDAIFGIGLTRDVREPYRFVIDTINRSRKKVVSVDVPSGIHADSGRVLGEAIKADLCVTFVRPKRGFACAKAYTGRVVVRDISVPTRRGDQ